MNGIALAVPHTFDFKDPKGVNNVVFKTDAPLESINGTATGISGSVTFDPDNPGFRHILISPYPAGDLTFVKGTHQTMYGTIASSWKRAGGAFTLDVTVPPNTTATVWVPAKNAGAVTESGKPVAGARGVKLLRSGGAAAVFEVESGSYSFRSAM